MVRISVPSASTWLPEPLNYNGRRRKSRLFLYLLFTLCVSCSAQPVETTEPLELVTMTYNIHHGAGADGVIDLQRIADVILSAAPDLVALQEVDRFVERTNRMDQAEELAALTGMEMHFGFADTYQGGDFGNLILSRFPVDTLLLHPLPGPPGETRVLMEARLQIPHGDEKLPITFMATHLETFEAPRIASASMITDVIPESPAHLYILGGDLNATPAAQTIDTLSLKLTNPTASAPVLTFPASNPVRQLDYLMYSGPPAWDIERIFALDAPISSDHAPLVAVFIYRPE